MNNNDNLTNKWYIEKNSQLKQQLSWLLEQFSWLQAENESLKKNLKEYQALLNLNNIEKTVSDDIKNELELLYWYKNIILSNISKNWNYIIADADNLSQQPGSVFTIVAWKINNKWVSFYEWNSWEISCKITDLFWFPKELLEAYNPKEPCYESAEYTIPEKTIKIKNQHN